MNAISKKEGIFLAFLLAIPILAAYATTLSKPFLWDDLPFILYETRYQELSNIPSFFIEDVHRLYRPLRSVAYTLAYAVFEHSPIAYRAIALFLHLAVTWLFARIVFALGVSKRAAWLAGLIFALHPVHADRVANTTAAFDLVGIVFGFAAFLSYLTVRNRKGSRGLWLFALLLTLGLFGSEECLAIPMLIVGHIWLFPGKFTGKTERRALLAALGPVAAYLLCRTLVLGQLGRVEGAAPFFSRMATMAGVVWHEFAIVLLPIFLRPAYGTKLQESLFSPTAMAGMAGLILVLVILWKRRGRGDIFAFGLAWFFITLAPFSNIIPGDTFMAERYLYVPLGGVALMVAAVADRARWLDSSMRHRYVLTRALCVACLFLMGLFTANRGYVWADESRLWVDAYRKDDRAWLILVNLGNEIKKGGIPGDPCPLFERSLRLHPKRGEAYVGAGECALRRKDFDGALKLFLKGRRLLTGDKAPLEGLSQLYVLREEFAKAEEAARLLLDLDPDSLVAHYVLGYIHFHAGQKEKAVIELRAAVASSRGPAETARAAKNLLRRIHETTTP